MSSVSRLWLDCDIPPNSSRNGLQMDSGKCSHTLFTPALSAWAPWEGTGHAATVLTHSFSRPFVFVPEDCSLPQLSPAAASQRSSARPHLLRAQSLGGGGGALGGEGLGPRGEDEAQGLSASPPPDSSLSALVPRSSRLQARHGRMATFATGCLATFGLLPAHQAPKFAPSAAFLPPAPRPEPASKGHPGFSVPPSHPQCLKLPPLPVPKPHPLWFVRIRRKARRVRNLHRGYPAVVLSLDLSL